jgi:hypothetical protein
MRVDEKPIPADEKPIPADNFKKYSTKHNPKISTLKPKI